MLNCLIELSNKIVKHNKRYIVSFNGFTDSNMIQIRKIEDDLIQLEEIVMLDSNLSIISSELKIFEKFILELVTIIKSNQILDNSFIEFNFYISIGSLEFCFQTNEINIIK